jgi:hypothetical protein
VEKMESNITFNITYVTAGCSKTFTCNAGNIYVTGGVALQSGQNVIITPTNDFFINTGTSAASSGNGQVGGYLDINSNSIKIQGTLLSSGSVCNYNQYIIKGGDAGKIDTQTSNIIGVTGIVTANEGTTQGYDNFLGNGGNVNIFANSIDIARSVSAKAR